MDIEVRPARDEQDLRSAWSMLWRAFGWDPNNFERFSTGSPIENFLCVLSHGDVVACSRIRDFGQFFGGRRVPMGGFSPVGVAADHRGRGYGSMVTAGQYPRLRENGQVLAGLYPATNALYRKVGFELAGAWVAHEGRTRDLHALPRAGGIATRLATEDDHGAIEACYARVARKRPGFLDRGEPWWERVFTREPTQQIYVVDGRDGIDGYVRYRLHWDSPPGATVEVDELIADDTDVERALWRLVASSSSIAEHVTFVGPPEHPLLLWLPDQVFKRRREWRWMTRIIDAPGAIAARGYPPAARAAFDLRVTDPQCDWNDARFRLVVDDGDGRLVRGGSGAVELGIGALSSLYTGYASAFTLAAAGLLRGATAEQCAALDSVFSGPAPWMPDFY